MASGNNINLHFSIFVSVIPMQSHTKSWNQSRSTVLHENEKKRSYTRHDLDIEHGSFTPLVFISISTGGMGPECLRFHSRLAERIANKKGEHYSRTILWIRARTFLCFIEICADLLKRVKNNPIRCNMDLTKAGIDIQNWQRQPFHKHFIIDYMYIYDM